MKKCFKYDNFLHYEHFTTAIIATISHVVELLSKLNSTRFF